MKFWIALFITFAIGLAACTTPAVTYTCSDGTQVTSLDDCPAIPEPEPEPQPPEPEPELPPQPEQLSAELQELFAKTSNVRSMSYDYVDPEISPASENWWVMGELAKTKLVTPQAFYVNNDFDTVYLNKAAKTAAGYCEDMNEVNCPTPNKQFPAKFAEYNKKTPFEWIAAVPSTAVQKAGPQYDQRTTVRIDWTEETENQNYQWTMLVWDYYGIPVKIDRTIAGDTPQVTTWTFRNVAVNLVKQSDLEHQTVPTD